MPPSKKTQNIFFGVVMMGGTGLLIGYFLHSYTIAVIAGALGTGIGVLVGWLGAKRFMVIILIGTGLGAFFGYQSGDRDIMIMATGSGAAIAGFIGAQIELFFRKR